MDGANVSDVMGWIDKLSPSAAQFWGAVVGVGGGLLAILAGALFNARLNRLRDDRLRDAEARAVAAAIKGEVETLERWIVSRVSAWEEGERRARDHVSRAHSPKASDERVDASEYVYLSPYDTPIFVANASRLGLLGPNLAGEVAIVYSNFRARASFSDRQIELRISELPERFADYAEWGRQFCKICQKVVLLLNEFEDTGKSGSHSEN